MLSYILEIDVVNPGYLNIQKHLKIVNFGYNISSKLKKIGTFTWGQCCDG